MPFWIHKHPTGSIFQALNVWYRMKPWPALLHNTKTESWKCFQLCNLLRSRDLLLNLQQILATAARLAVNLPPPCQSKEQETLRNCEIKVQQSPVVKRDVCFAAKLTRACETSAIFWTSVQTVADYWHRGSKLWVCAYLISSKVEDIFWLSSFNCHLCWL